MKTLSFICSLIVLSACNSDKPIDTPPPTHPKTFTTSFESVDEFSQFYIVPQNTPDPTSPQNQSHDLTNELARSGSYSHKGWIWGSNPDSTPLINNNHRGYPTIQLYKTATGAFKTPVLIEFWAWLDVTLAPGEWFSFATLDPTRVDIWDPVLVNLSHNGFVHLMHVPSNGEKVWDFQTDSISFPMQEWVKLSVCLHFDQHQGYAKVWQNNQLVSSAAVHSGNGELTQAHFGLYAPPSLTSGTVYNDDLQITEGECM